MDEFAKLSDLTPYMVHEDVEPQQRRNIDPAAQFPIHFAALPNGKRFPLLKTAMTTACEMNCNYCAFRSGRDGRRINFSAETLACTFMSLYRAGVVKGLFLSSGIAGGGLKTQDRILTTAEILRNKYHFQGYIHLKIMPGAEKAQVERGMQLADRVSVNLEAPSTTRLLELAPRKRFFKELMAPLRWIDMIRNHQSPANSWKGNWPSSSTQFVVGGGKETDLELLNVSERLIKDLHLKRIYYSGFNPVRGTPLENHKAVNPLREFRLYQASYLFRDYEYDLEDIHFSKEGFLSLDKDPKSVWAEENLLNSPLEINTAIYQELIKVPGIGPKNAKKIIVGRKKHPLKSLEDLKNLGIQVKRVKPFILLNGSKPVYQPALW
ncbi:MAG: helix-hairpin-helix domain-containing protein [Anaerolineaceae bacterium]|nr:helix-hairpin-helix domain-containing protein [Anaerolineaceae bacterium]